MEIFFFLFVGFIILSAMSDNAKKQKKNPVRGLNPTPTLNPKPNDQSQDASVWENDAVPTKATYENTTFSVNTQTLKAAQRKRAKRQVKQSRLRKQKLSWSKPSFGQSTIAIDKNKSRARGFENGRARTVLDGKRVFGLVALSSLAVYVLGQV